MRWLLQHATRMLRKFPSRALWMPSNMLYSFILIRTFENKETKLEKFLQHQKESVIVKKLVACMDGVSLYLEKNFEEKKYETTI